MIRVFDQALPVAVFRLKPIVGRDASIKTGPISYFSQYDEDQSTVTMRLKNGNKVKSIKFDMTKSFFLIDVPRISTRGNNKAC